MKHYQTKDKTVTPYLLLCPDVELVSTRLIGYQVWFEFSPADKAEDLAMTFYAGNAEPVNPKEFSDKIRHYYDLVTQAKMGNFYRPGDYFDNKFYR